MIESETGYDIAGDIIWSKDGAGRITRYDETLIDGYVVKTRSIPDGTLTPSGNQQIEKYYQDGRLYQQLSLVTSTSSRGTTYSYHVDGTTGCQYQVATPLNNGTAVTTAAVSAWRDYADRPWKVIAPSPTETGTATQTNYYATPSISGYKPGQLYKVTKSGYPDTLYKYDTLGQLSAEGLDLNSDGLLTTTSGVDRVTEYLRQHTGTQTSIKTVKKWVSATSYLSESTTFNYTLGGWISRTEKPGEGIKNFTLSRRTTFASYNYSESIGSVAVYKYYTFGRPSSLIKMDHGYGDSAILSNVTYVYDVYGNLSSETDTLKGTTTYFYDGAHRLTSVTTPDPDTTADTVGLRAMTTTIERQDLGQSDGFGWRETKLKRHSGATGPVVEKTVSEYYPTGELRLTYGANTSPSKYTYDFAGRVKTLTTWRDFNLSTGQGVGPGDVTTWNYNDAGLLKSKRYADNKGPDYTYDLAGRLKTRDWARSVSGTRLRTTYIYDPQTGNLTSIDYPSNSDTTDVVYSNFDRLGRPSTILDASGTRTQTYSSVFNIGTDYTAGDFSGLAMAAPKDAYGRLNSLSLTVNGTTDYAIYYNWMGQNRLSSVSWYKEFDNGIDEYSFQEFYINYEYQDNPNLTSRRAYYFYDSQGTGYDSPGIAFTKTYDKLSRVKSVGTELDVDEEISLTYTYNDRDQRSRVTSENGAYWSYGYDSDTAADATGQVTSAARKNAAGTTAPGFDFNYAYDRLGNRTSETTNGSVTTYYQGAAGTGSTGDNAINQYGSRSVPRLLDVAGLAAASDTVWVNGQIAQRLGENWYKRLTYTSNAAQLQPISIVTSSGNNTSGNLLLKGHPENYSYDDDGNLLGDGRWNYFWDMENRLRRMETCTSAVSAGVTRKRIDYTYDDRSRRVFKKVFNWNTTTANYHTNPVVKVGFAYQDWTLLAELDLLAPMPTYIRRYIWGTDLSGTMDGAGGVGGLLAIELYPGMETLAVGSDANGNVVDLVDMASGERRVRYDYDAFGNTYTKGTGWGPLNPFRFSTKYTETDGTLTGNETGLVYYGYRFYMPNTGRWPNRDPIQEKGGMNLYRMVNNNAVGLHDLLGLAVIVFNPRDDDGNRYPLCKIPCDKLREFIADLATKEVGKRIRDARLDSEELWSTAKSVPQPGKPGTWDGHKEQFNNQQKRLNAAIDEYNKRCGGGVAAKCSSVP